MQRIEISTKALLGCLATIMAWELEIFVALLHTLSSKKFNIYLHLALLVMALSVTAYARTIGKADFDQYRHTAGRAHLTQGQSLLVVAAMVSMGSVIGLLIML